MQVRRPNERYYTGTYIRREKIIFHKVFIDEIQNIIIENNFCNTGFFSSTDEKNETL